MKIIVWLGNPWEKYTYTRHNLWFLFLDYLKEKLNFSEFSFESKFKWEISSWLYNWGKVILLKPQTFMNLSWESIIAIKNFYKLDVSDFIVVYDDMSMDFWKIRFRDKWSAWWHNGIKDIIKHFWENFKRVKVWVWFNDKFEVSDWVLSKFTEEELIDLDNEIYKNIKLIIDEKI